MAGQESHAFGSDSFLDVVTNMVGILIVLVMVVGVRIKHGPDSSQLTPSVPPNEIARLESEAEAIERNIVELESQIAQVALTTDQRRAERGTLAVLVEERERELTEARGALDKGKQSLFDLQRERSAAETELERNVHGLREAEQAAKTKKPTIQIKNYPTPLSQTVFGDEAHFQLLAGRVTWVPFNELSELCKLDAEPRVHRLRDVSEISSVVGPIDGFRAKYVLEREDLSPEEMIRFGSRGPRLAFSVELIPARDDLGEPVAVAMGKRSQFRARLATFSPRHKTVTLWTYPDGFGAYAAIKEELHRLGFTVAARPLPDGVMIGGSNHGSHSQAQ
jgi:hypothetical protein